MIVLGSSTDVTTITKQDIKQVNQPLNVNVNVKVQDGQVRDLVRSEVETNNQQAFNMLMQGGPN